MKKNIRAGTPFFFKSKAAMRQWLQNNHHKVNELWVGYYKVGTGKAGITWSETVDEAICFGWIDGVRKSIDELSYMIRFTPRKPGSIWSAVNIAKAENLTQKGLMDITGLKAFEKRDPAKSRIYSFEQPDISLGDVHLKAFKKAKTAWRYFCRQAQSYQKTAIWWVISAKQEVTREKRLNQLILDSTAGRRLKHLQRLP